MPRDAEIRLRDRLSKLGGLDLLRGDQRRLVILMLLPVLCYGVMAFEVWLVLWAVGYDGTRWDSL